MFEEENEDKREDPKPRKHTDTWQSYLWWLELFKMKQRHINRRSSIEKGKSTMDMEFEEDKLSIIEPMLENAQKTMANVGAAEFGEVWAWVTSIKGAGDHTAAKILAPIDDIAKFDTISKFWRFCGFGVIDGDAERGTEHYVRKIKTAILMPKGLAEQFYIRKTELYSDIYYAEKEYLREKYPAMTCDKCGQIVEKKINKKSPCCKAKVNYTIAHINNMAKRKAAKEFLKHLWLVWRMLEGLPITQPHNDDPLYNIPNFSIEEHEDGEVTITIQT